MFWFTLFIIQTFAESIPPIPLGIDSKYESLAVPPSPARVALGRHLFFDKRLSRDQSVSCASCHRPEFAFSEPTSVSTGVGGKKGTRKAPTIINLAWPLYPHYFWDGRANTMEQQAVGPIENPIEMANTRTRATATISAEKGYDPLFTAAFGTAEVTIERIAHALADYQRTRVSGNSRFDRWQAGETQLLTQSEKNGQILFFGKGRCNQCHLGENFTDSLFHNLGVGWDPKRKHFRDRGRGAISKKKEDEGAFKTPGLREVSKRAPYMHDGSIKTLREVVELYNRGGVKNPALSPKIEPLRLSRSEIEEIVAFLKTLDGFGYQDTPPADP